MSGSERVTGELRGRLVIVEVFFLLSCVRIRSLLNYTVYLDVSRDPQWYRRRHCGGDIKQEYFNDVGRATYGRYDRSASANADKVIDANGTKEEVWAEFRPIISSHLT